MNRKLIAFCTVFAVILLAVIGYVFYRLFDDSSSQKEAVAVNDSRMDVMHAVPADAVMMCDLNSLSDFASFCFDKNSQFSGMINQQSAIARFINILPESVKKQGASVSLHYSSKNQVSLLLAVSLPKSLDREGLALSLEQECAGVIRKKYNGVTMYKSVIPNIVFSLYHNYLLASTSVVIAESSIRHLENNTSIMDNALFSQASKRAQGKGSIHISNQNVGKFFSGVINRNYLKYADFTTFFSSWMMSNLDFSSNYCLGDGFFSSAKDEADFSNILTAQKSKESDVFRILPFNTNWVVTIPLNSDADYLASYKSYLEARKKINDYNYINIMASKSSGQNISTSSWFLSLGVKEMAVCSVTGEKQDEKVVLLKVKDISKMKNYSQEVNPFLFQGYLSALLGDFFSPSLEEAYCVVSDWVIIGSKQMVRKFLTMNSNQFFFSFESFLSQTPAASSYKGNSSLLAVANLSKCKDSLSSIVRKEYSQYLISGIENNNFNLFSFRIKNDGSKGNFSFSLYSDNLSELPKPQTDGAVKVQKNGAFDDTKVVIPAGPFKVKNFITGKANYIEQMDNYKIRLLDDKKKALWTVPFDSPLCGYVSQVDYFKNNKLQMILCSGTKVYLLDRLGRWVSPFPLDLKREIVLGPAIYDFKGDKNYVMMILHSDNKLALYDLKGKMVNGWTQITIDEKIKSLPFLLDMEDIRYWVVRTSYQTLIYDSNGGIVTDFSKKKRLKADTPINKISSKEISAVSAEGKEIILNLESGDFKNK